MIIFSINKSFDIQRVQFGIPSSQGIIVFQKDGYIQEVKFNWLRNNKGGKQSAFKTSSHYNNLDLRVINTLQTNLFINTGYYSQVLETLIICGKGFIDFYNRSGDNKLILEKNLKFQQNIEFISIVSIPFIGANKIPYVVLLLGDSEGKLWQIIMNNKYSKLNIGDKTLLKEDLVIGIGFHRLFRFNTSYVFKSHSS